MGRQPRCSDKRISCDYSRNIFLCNVLGQKKQVETAIPSIDIFAERSMGCSVLPKEGSSGVTLESLCCFNIYMSDIAAEMMEQWRHRLLVSPSQCSRVPRASNTSGIWWKTKKTATTAQTACIDE